MKVGNRLNRSHHGTRKRWRIFKARCPIYDQNAANPLASSVAESIGIWHAVVKRKATVDLEVDAGYETAEAIRQKRHCHVCDLVRPTDPAQRRRARVRF